MIILETKWRVETARAATERAITQVLHDELLGYGVPAAVAQTEAAQLMAAGYDSLEGTVAQVEAAATRVVAAQRSGDVTGARAEIADIRTTYDAALASLMRTADPQVGTATEDLLASLTERTSLTSHDVSLLAAQTGAVRSALLGGPAPAGRSGSRWLVARP